MIRLWWVMCYHHAVRTITVRHRYGGCSFTWGQASENKKAKTNADPKKEGAHKDMDPTCSLEEDSGEPVDAAKGKEMVCTIAWTLGVFVIIQ